MLNSQFANLNLVEILNIIATNETTILTYNDGRLLQHLFEEADSDEKDWKISELEDEVYEIQNTLDDVLADLDTALDNIVELKDENKKLQDSIIEKTDICHSYPNKNLPMLMVTNPEMKRMISELLMNWNCGNTRKEANASLLNQKLCQIVEKFEPEFLEMIDKQGYKGFTFTKFGYHYFIKARK